MSSDFGRGDGAMFKRTAGATATEAGLLVGLIAVILLGVLTAMGGNLNDVFEEASDALEDSIGFTPFYFENVEDAVVAGGVVSEEEIMPDLPQGTPISILSGGDAYLLYNGANVGTSVAVSSGDRLAVGVTSSDQPETETVVQIAVSDYYTISWHVKTGVQAPQDMVFDPVLLATPEIEYVSNPYVATGMTIPSPVQVQGDETVFYRLNEGAWTQEDGMLSAGDVLEVKMDSGPNDGTLKTATVIVGGVTASWQVTSIDAVVGGVNLTDLTDQPLGSVVQSEIITPIDYDQAVPLSVSAPEGNIVEISLNGGAWEEGPVTLSPEESFQLQTTTPVTDETELAIALSIGEMPFTWNVSTGDTTPVSFDLSALDIVGAPENTLVETTGSFRPSGMTAPAEISIDHQNGSEYSIDYGDWVSSASLLDVGSSIRLRLGTGNGDGEVLTSRLTIGGVSADWHVTTADITPDNFVFDPETGAEISTYVQSQPVLLTGIDTEVTATIDDGDLSSDNGATFSSTVVVPVGGSLIARTLSSNSLTTEKQVTVTIGTVSSVFSVTTRGNDDEPDAGSIVLADITDAEPEAEIISATITPTGIDAPMTFSITSGSALISVQGGAWQSSGTVNPGKSLTVKTTSDTYEGQVVIGYDAGGVTGTWRVTTRSQDAEPNAFSFSNLTKQTAETAVASEQVTPTGFSDPVTISVSGGEVRIAGGGWTTSGVLNKGENLQLRVTTGIADGVTSSVVLTAGSYTTTWQVTTVDTMMDDLWTSSELSSTLLERDFNCCQCIPIRTVTGIDTPAVVNSITRLEGGYGANIRSNGAYRGVGYRVQPGGDLALCISFSSGSVAGQVGRFLYNIGGKEFILTGSTSAGAGAGPYYSLTIEDIAGADKDTDYIGQGYVDGNKIPSPVQVSSPAYIRLKGTSAWVGSNTNITVPVNGRFEVLMRSSAADNTSVSTVVYVNKGGSMAKAETWSITTAPPDNTPDPISDASTTGTTINAHSSYRSVSFTGFNACFNLRVEGQARFVVYTTSGPSKDWGTERTVCPGQRITTSFSPTPSTPGAQSQGVYYVNGVKWWTETYTLDGSIDGTPDQFSFVNVSGATAGAEVQSNSVALSSSLVPMTFTVSGDSSALAQVNGGAWARSGTVNAGQTMRLKMTAGGATGETRTATLSVAGVSASWSVSSQDTAPSGFSFSNLSDVEPDAILGSEKITLSGFDGVVPVTVTGDSSATVSVRGGSQTRSTTASAGDVLQLWMTSGSHDVTRTATVTVGGTSAAWSVKTRSADATPNGFSFVPVTGASGNSLVTSQSVRIGGFLDEPLAISVSGQGSPQISVNGGAWTSSADLYANQLVSVRLTSGEEDGSSRQATVSVGGVSGDFTVTTVDAIPNNFNVTNVGNAVSGERVSTSFTVSGIDTDISVAVSGQGSPTLSVNSGSERSSATVGNGDVVTVSMTAPEALSTTSQATVSLGSLSQVWSVTSTIGQ